ncbi:MULTISPECIES: ABC transporter ATP-binding protein [Chryseobacterium]|uniref:ATP-binding cassette subfamily B multidrug efflux pump n=1 Tax=Chryseobacterium camelliae TaxID=1265445 RepID=A0ABU0TL54_9FLAO|nr:MULTISPECIES: ABC transporter ATP-binding protein [Chryseobacterium]MDT3408370.1 ATP-binding cassette subfamily B multidrug efflux pump [Pseudacidovorax intermedius]MDQ1097772.1 ATP-binding cassette subfamily B multidrug efflux pump [Chryseobacterium camelliae]MDQ1101706.1 ATP-binding cassette subfamily B multidrug efflux pump [Chryseobacterium sp. SORGH_AS_1048]MDR6085144.1 ATP-binding cassette subfamily B multidrug efflux pump [Chryseobacterium sp. SORGH_AS_0909]MDR6129503.1 ATP-binding c
MKALKTLNPYFWKHKLLLFWGLLFIIASNFFNIYKVQFVGKSVDELTKSGNLGFNRQVLIYVAIIVGCSLLTGFFTFMMRQTIIVASRRIEYELKNKIYRHYQELSLTDYKQTTIGDLMNRLSEDVVAVRMYLGPGVMYVVNLVILLVITSIYMLKTDVSMTVWTLLPLPVLSYIIFKVSSIINKKSKIMQKSQSAISTFVQDSFSGIRVVKFFAREKYIEKNYGIKVTDYQNKALDLAKTEAYFFTIILFVIGLLNVVIIFIGGQKYISGHLSVGKIADFFMYINILIWPFSMVGWVTSVNQRAEASMQRINEFMDKKTEIVNTNFDEYTIKGDIEFRNVSYIYPNTGIKALDNLSFKVKAGESLAIMGKTGSGKSTIALLLCRLIDPSSGEILVDGKNLKEHNLDNYRRFIGYIPQESYLFSDSIENNIGFAIDHPSHERVVEYAKIADVHKNIIDFKEQYKTMVGERGVMLSGGQKQRICIARALIKNPNIIIFDDSLSALDTETEHNILENIEAKIQNATSIIITHRESSAQKAHQIINLTEINNSVTS